jgi:hypothetical protein
MMISNSFGERIAPQLSGRAARTLLNRAWPLAGVGIALIANAIWIGALGYGLSKLF